MEKKTYIKPSIKSVCLLIQNHLASESVKQVSSDSNWAARESSIWDDEEEEENTGGWFQ